MSITSIKVLVTGGNGQVGSEIRDQADQYPEFSFTFVDLDDLDLTNEDNVKRFIVEHKFAAIINCAAYTAVDLAEDQPELAFKVNADAVKTLAQTCREHKIRLIHISTDYVFSGTDNQPLNEDVTPAPLSVYGESKLKGEQYVLSTLPDAYIIRTAWVYSSYGKNFVKTIASLARQREELSVVADQIGTPTYAADLAQAILDILRKALSGVVDQPGIYHYSNEGVISWYDFAHFIIRHFSLPCRLKAIRTEEYKTKATRPKFSLLSKRKITDTFDIVPPHWHDSLLKCLPKL